MERGGRKGRDAIRGNYAGGQGTGDEGDSGLVDRVEKQRLYASWVRIEREMGEGAWKRHGEQGKVKGRGKKYGMAQRYTRKS